jgi:hypothetical protein
MAENLLRDPEIGSPDMWRLTFKMRRLIPFDRTREVGAGGEVSVLVDLRTGAATMGASGE